MKSGTQPKAFRIFGAITAHNTPPTKILKWWTFENSFLSWGQMAKRKTASCWINDDFHRGTAMALRFYILDIKVSSQPWAHKIVADGTFALHLKQKSGNHISPNMLSGQRNNSKTVKNINQFWPVMFDSHLCNKLNTIQSTILKFSLFYREQKIKAEIIKAVILLCLY